MTAVCLQNMFVFQEPIRAMAISKKYKTLYVTSDSLIKQIPLKSTCSKSYSNCVECVRDPHCGWDREQGTCQGFDSHLLQVILKFICILITKYTVPNGPENLKKVQAKNFVK